MYTIFLIIYLLIAISLVLLIMVQQGKGIDIGGDISNIRNILVGWNTNNVNDFMSRFITILGVLFFVFSLLLGNISNKHNQENRDLSHDSNSLLQFKDEKNHVD